MPNRVVRLYEPGDPPSGKPIAGTTNLGDVEWALTKARRWIFRGGDQTDPRYREYLDCWLDYRAEIAGTTLEHVGSARELTPAGPDSDLPRNHAGSGDADVS